MTEPELKTLGRYTIERVLGRGGMGVVYEGVDPRLNRRVAIKTVLKSNLDQDMAKEYSARFVREAQIAARLSHPHIVQIHDFGEEGDIAYLVMEFIKGRELRIFFDANERFELKETVRIMGELCDALDFAHQAGIIHRDVKPANVMLDSRARVKLADFGVARIQDASLSHVTVSMVGTPAYMSPEQISGGSVDKRTDVFSAGIILYQFLTGEMPFAGGGAWTVAKQIMQDQPRLPSSLNRSISPLLDGVVYKALAKNAGERYQSAHELAVALRQAFAGEAAEEQSARTIVAPLRPADVPPKLLSTEPPTIISAPRHDLVAPREAELKPQASAGARKTSAVVAIVAGVVLAAGGATYWLLSGSDDKMRQMQQQLEQARKQAQELEQAKRKQEEARIALEKARAAEAEARRSGDIARQKELLAARQKAEAEAKKEAEAARVVEQQKLAAERAAAQEKAAAVKLAEEKERQQWDAVKTASHPRDIERYLSAYPNGHYAELARTLQAKLANDLKMREMLEAQQRAQAEAKEREEQAAKEKQQGEKRKPVFVPPTF